jgi:hypothetical protein
LAQNFVSFGAFLCGRDLGLFGDVWGSKEDKSGSFISLTSTNVKKTYLLKTG